MPPSQPKLPDVRIPAMPPVDSLVHTLVLLQNADSLTYGTQEMVSEDVQYRLYVESTNLAYMVVEFMDQPADQRFQMELCLTPVEVSGTDFPVLQTRFRLLGNRSMEPQLLTALNHFVMELVSQFVQKTGSTTHQIINYPQNKDMNDWLYANMYSPISPNIYRHTYFSEVDAASVGSEA